ncbi:MAG: redoxin domain-containing protein [Candidatus Obscuribacterales bacterium]|nr:redoxin domain-containing protein [Candidatus Obscuribacterales bacterium]
MFSRNQLLRRLSLAMLLLLVCAVLPNSVPAFAAPTNIGSAAPDFTGNKGWLNTSKPISIKDLRGKVVLLDFWTYCCINCMHAIPTLKALEAKYPNELVVLGVHSGKFNNEKDLENIRAAVARYDVRHPVVNDPEMTIWGAYGVDSWPYFVLIDPSGKIVTTARGEPGPALIEQVDSLISTSRGNKSLKSGSLNLVAEKDKIKTAPLMFPGKVLADQATGRLIISDSGHNRIIGADFNGQVQFVIGSGKKGFADGSFARAQLNAPQGLALKGEELFIADTENHAIRVANLKLRTVSTIAGNGKQARTREGGVARTVALNSPWDLTFVGGKLYVAMAGAHQIWQYSPTTKQIVPWSGSGRERNLDGAASHACFAQPSGLTSDGKKLYVADSEVSGVRSVNLSDGTASTIVGKGLFDFGDKDGIGPAARLQHPLGVLWYEGKLYVADSYNHKIKILDPSTKLSSTLLGTGKPGGSDGAKPAFSEPGGVSGAGGKLFIADTNNHAIRVYDLKSKLVSTLQLSKL